MAENALTGVDTSSYPKFQPIQQQNPLAQMQAAQGLALQQQSLQSQQFALGKQRLDYLHDQMGSLAAKVDPQTGQPNASFQDVTNVATNLVRMGYPPDQVSAELANAPKDPAGIRAWATQHMAGIANHAQRLELGYGGTQAVNTRGALNTYATRPQTPGILYDPKQGGAPTASVPMTMSPEEAAAPETLTDVTGSQRQMTRGQALAEKGVNPVTPQLAGAFRQPTAQGQQGVQGPGATFGPSLEAYNADMRSSSDLAKTIRTSSQALNLADALGITGTGPGTKPFNDAKAFLESVGITAPNDAVSMRNELDKYLQQTVNNSPLAQRSDMGTLATKLGTPNTTEQTNAATRALLRTGIAQAGMDAAVPHAYDWQGNGGSVAGYIQHKGSFTQNQDQQAYALAQGLMKPEEAKSLLDKMNALPNSSAQKQKFFSSLANAKKAGLVNLPNAQGQ